MESLKNFMSPINNMSVVQQVIDRLTMAMIHKELRPGDKIPTELELSTNFGVGRNSVREAIKILVSFGILEIKRPEGTFVTSGFSDKMIDPLLYGIILDETDSLGSLKELREWIDTGMILLAMEKASKEDLLFLEQAVIDLEKVALSGEVELLFEADNAFHHVLAKITHNSLFGKIANLVRLLTYDMRYRTIKNMIEADKGKAMIRVHQKIFQLVKNQDKNQVREVVQKSYLYDEGALDK